MKPGAKPPSDTPPVKGEERILDLDQKDSFETPKPSDLKALQKPKAPDPTRILEERKSQKTPIPEAIQREFNRPSTHFNEEEIDRIESMFGEFGPAVCAYILTQLHIQGGIGRTVQKLEMRSRGRISADMAQIENWILSQGVEKFCSKVGIRLKPHEIATPPPHEPGDDATQPLRVSTPDLKIKPINPSTPSLNAEQRSKITSGGVNRKKDGAVAHHTPITFKPIGLGKDSSQTAKKPENSEPEQKDMSPCTPPRFPFSPSNTKTGDEDVENAPGASCDNQKKPKF